MHTRIQSRQLSLLVGSAFFMEQLDSTIIAPAIPQIAADFGVEPLHLNFTLTLYLLCTVIFIPTGAWLTGRFGARRVFRAALAVFTVSSFLCGAAPNLPSLVAARALQGASAALMVPVGRMAIVHTVERRELVLALAWMITPAMVGPLVGPMLGGLIASYADWPWIFYVNVPIGVAGYLFSRRVFPALAGAPRASFDVLEWALLGTALGGLVLLTEALRHAALSWPALCMLALGTAFAAAACARRMRSKPQPLLDFSLLRLPTFRASFWAGALIRVGYGALPFLLPLLLQLGLGLTPVQSGAILLASGAVALFTKTQTTRILRQYGFRTVLLWNGALAALALGACAFFAAGWSPWLIALVVALGGLFRSVQFNALAAIAYADTRPDRIASATTLNTVFQQLAVMSGIAVSAVVVESCARWRHGGVPQGPDFAVAFLLVAGVALAAVPFCAGLAPQAGRELSGHAG